MWVVGVRFAHRQPTLDIMNKKIVHKIDSVSITAVELSSGWAFLCFVMPFYFYFTENQSFMPSGWYDILWLLILSWLCTTLAFLLSLGVMKHLSAFTVNLTISLEPIYSIILAFFIFQEHNDLSKNFYWGALLILTVVLSHPMVKRFENKNIKCLWFNN